jgi:2-haloacid dehalogenase
MMKLVSMPAVVLLDVNGTLTDLRPIGAPWGRSELGAAVLDGAVKTAMVDALLGTGDRPFSDHLRASLKVLVADAGLDFNGLEAAMAAAAELPARPDAATALALLADADVRIVALTNSGAESGVRTLRGCGLLGYVERVLGVDAVASFKPHPSVYTYALAELRCDARDVTLIATHPWDLAGATHAGITTAWVTHGARGWPTVFPSPDIRGDSLLQVAEEIVS